MKYKNLIVLMLTIFFLTVFTGCMREDPNDCSYEGNFTLCFTYPDETGQDIFAENIESVSIYVFDKYYNFVTATYADIYQIKEFQGVVLTLPAGDYYIVGWGNHIETNNYPVLSESHTINNSYFRCDPFTGPFFYAPANPFKNGVKEDDFFKISIPEHGSAKAIFPFMNASRPVQITVIGLEDYVQEEKVGPIVEMTAIPEGYDFLLANLANKKTYSKKAVCSESHGNTSFVTFHTPFFTITPDIKIHLYRQSDGNHIYTTNLYTVLETLKEQPQTTEPLDIEIKFYSGGITISINGWEEGEILTPDF